MQETSHLPAHGIRELHCFLAPDMSQGIVKEMSKTLAGRVPWEGRLSLISRVNAVRLGERDKMLKCKSGQISVLNQDVCGLREST